MEVLVCLAQNAGETLLKEHLQSFGNRAGNLVLNNKHI